MKVNMISHPRTGRVHSMWSYCHDRMVIARRVGAVVIIDWPTGQGWNSESFNRYNLPSTRPWMVTDRLWEKVLKYWTLK